MAAGTVRIEVGERAGVGVVALRGVADDRATMVRLVAELLALGIDGGHLVLDLGGLQVRDSAVLRAFFARIEAAGTGVPIPTVVPDPAARRLLRSAGSGSAGLALFADVDEAVDVVRPTLGPAPAPAPAPVVRAVPTGPTPRRRPGSPSAPASV